MKFLNDWKIVTILCLTLGLAPFYPEPHILGKIKWIWGGANGMKLIDWWDVVLHGTPFILAIRTLIITIKSKLK